MKDLVLAFAPAVRNGKVSPAWKKTHLLAGEALIFTTGATSISEAWFLAQNVRTLCLTCGSKTNFDGADRKYSRFCSARCGALHSTVKNLRQQTNLLRHGTKNAGGFGTEQHKNSLLKKYGVEHPMHSAECKNRLAKTNVERYGAENVFAAVEIKKKITNTHLTTRGCAHPMQDAEIKAKYRDDEGRWKPAISNKSQRASAKLSSDIAKVRKRLGEAGFNLLSNPHGFSYQHKHSVRHISCNKEFDTVLYSGALPRCPVCDPFLAGTSLLEKKVEDFILSLGIKTVTGDRTTIGKEIDILLPHHQLGIEVNGLYWHSELAGKTKNYHLDKTNAARLAGITLLHLFEDDVLQKWEIVQSMLTVRLGLSRKIVARSTSAEKLTIKEASAFCEANHLKGSARSTVAYGLRYNGNLVACCTFAPARYKKEKQTTELIRFCTARNLTVTGGFSKILKKFILEEKPSKIVTYADQTYSTGNLYRQAGFKFTHTTSPSYWYFSNTQKTRVHRSQLSKNRLHKLYANIDTQKTEWQILQEEGWNRIWDCGQLVFELQPNYST